MKNASTRNTVLKGVAALALVALAAGAPSQSHGFTYDNGPDRQWVDLGALYRMNDDTLFALSRNMWVQIQGEMDRFRSTIVIRAILFAPDRTRRLIDRIATAGTDARALDILNKEIAREKKRHGLAYTAFSTLPASANTELVAYHNLLQHMALVLWRAEERRTDPMKSLMFN